MKTSSAEGSKAKARPRVEQEKSAGAVVFHRGEQVEYLLIYSTYWEFPKGLIEANESEAEAAVREVREETGLEVELLPDFRQDINYFYRRGERLIKKQVTFFLAESRHKRVTVSYEHEKAQWLTFDQALEQIKYENSRALLRRANHHLTGSSR